MYGKYNDPKRDQLADRSFWGAQKLSNDAERAAARKSLVAALETRNMLLVTPALMKYQRLVLPIAQANMKVVPEDEPDMQWEFVDFPAMIAAGMPAEQIVDAMDRRWGIQNLKQ